MEPSVLARAVEPFFTSKEIGKGTGLGLSMVKGFTEQSGGGFAVASQPGTGTVVSLWLPRATATAEAPGPAASFRSAVERSGSCILLVDDDELVRDTLAEQLETAGIAVMQAVDGMEALEQLKEHADIRLLLTDLSMPGMNGLSLIGEARRIRPRLPAILLTGFAGDVASLAVKGAASESYSLIRKPVSGVLLIDRITAMLEA